MNSPNDSTGSARIPGNLSGPLRFGRNFAKKVRKHIQQVRQRTDPPEAIPAPSTGGMERVREIIEERVAQGGGRDTSFAGQDAVAFDDGGVTYVVRPDGEFWTIMGN